MLSKDTPSMSEAFLPKEVERLSSQSMMRSVQNPNMMTEYGIYDDKNVPNQ